MQRKDDMIKKCISDVQRCAYFMISNDMNNFFGFQRKKMTNSASGQLGSGSLNNLEVNIVNMFVVDAYVLSSLKTVACDRASSPAI